MVLYHAPIDALEQPAGSSQEDPANSERQVCGYSILQAESLEEASELLNGHPHLGWNPACEIEIHESLALPGS